MLPVPDELLGSRLLAVVTADGADGAGDLTREGVLDHCRQWLLESAGDGRPDGSRQSETEGTCSRGDAYQRVHQLVTRCRAVAFWMHIRAVRKPHRRGFLRRLAARQHLWGLAGSAQRSVRS